VTAPDNVNHVSIQLHQRSLFADVAGGAISANAARNCSKGRRPATEGPPIGFNRRFSSTVGSPRGIWTHDLLKYAY
jgi:hypothetical protein